LVGADPEEGDLRSFLHELEGAEVRRYLAGLHGLLFFRAWLDGLLSLAFPLLLGGSIGDGLLADGSGQRALGPGW
jgi:hypothetical protein